jgi:catechol 2,3-dioxygenase-like lactoylglutathione lyase family enzyme
MAIDFNHTIVWARDSEASAAFLSEILGLPTPKRWGPFLVVTTANGTNLDFMNADGEISPQHYAFLVSEPEFDQIFDRVRERSLFYWADPAQSKAGEINRSDGGRGFYFEDPNGLPRGDHSALWQRRRLRGPQPTPAARCPSMTAWC